MKNASINDKLRIMTAVHYQITPHSINGMSPAQFMIGINLKSHCDLLIPNLVNRMEQKTTATKQNHDIHIVSCQFQMEEKVCLCAKFQTTPPGHAWL